MGVRKHPAGPAPAMFRAPPGGQTPARRKGDDAKEDPCHQPATCSAPVRKIRRRTSLTCQVTPANMPRPETGDAGFDILEGKSRARRILPPQKLARSENELRRRA